MEQYRNPGSSSAADQVAIDDEKVEKFYEIIRNYKEARDRHRIAMQTANSRMKKPKLRDREQPIWTPAFKLEDFAPAEQGRSSVIPSDSSSGEVEKEKRMREDGGAGLDLELRL